MAKYGINKVILVGNLGDKPELKWTEGGIALARFRLATTDPIKTKDGQRKDRTEWHNITLWRGLAETAEKYLDKGSTVYIEGRITYRSWEFEGQTKYRTEIEADKLRMLSPPPQGTVPSKQEKKAEEGTPINQDPANDLPF